MAAIDYQIHTFSNGIRLIHKRITHTKIAHLGFVLDIGTRDEALSHQQGIAHFWEHMAFKGTSKRKSIDIINRLEAVGGELNAYTTKEKVCFYASVLDKYYSRAADLLTDITFNSTFPNKEIEKERQVILEEMAMYADTPDDAIADAFDLQLFGNHPLATNILGTAETVKAFKREDFLAFYADKVDTEKLVLASVGNFSMAEVLKVITPLLAPIPHKRATSLRVLTVPGQHTPHIVSETKPITQAHCIMGCPTIPFGHPDRIPLFMLTNILGGPGMNSKLNMVLRERNGLVYGAEAGFSPFSDTGLFSIYFATEAKQLRKSIKLTFKELEKLRAKPLTKSQFQIAQQQMMGQLAMAEESNINLMLMLGKALLDHNRVESLPEIFSLIKGTTSSKLQDLANQYLVSDNLSMLSYLPDTEDAEEE